VSFLEGDRVRIVDVPPSARALPAEVHELLVAVVGRTLRVDDVNPDTGFVALNVHADGSQAADWCQHTVWLEPEYVALVSRKAGSARHP